MLGEEVDVFTLDPPEVLQPAYSGTLNKMTIEGVTLYVHQYGAYNQSYSVFVPMHRIVKIVGRGRRPS